MSTRLPVALLPLAFVVGCGGEPPNARFTTVGSTIGTTAAMSPAAQNAPGGADRAVAAVQNAAPAPAAPRRVIFNGSLDLKVDDVEQTAAKLRTLIDQMGGYVSKSDVSGSPGARLGTLTARLPVKQFPAAIEQFATLGTVNRSASDSQDVTEEFVDVEARLKNYKAEEVALNKLLESSGGRLEDIFKIREQIARNRAEVERIEGRLKYLSNQTELSTLTLTLREEKAPGPPPASPTFGERLTATFARSVAKLREFCEEVILFVVAVGPWLPVLLVLGWLGLVILRRLVRLSEPSPRPRRPVPVASPLTSGAVAEVTPPAATPSPAPAADDPSGRTAAASP